MMMMTNLKDSKEEIDDEAEDCPAASTYSRWKRKSEASGGGIGSRRVGVNPQGQAPPHIFIQSEHTHYKPYLGLFQKKLR